MSDLTRWSTADLGDVRRAVAHGAVRCPLTEAGLAAAGHGRLVALVPAVAGLSAEAVLLVLDAILAERAARPAPPELVWSGPEAPTAATRDTAVVVAQLFERARRSVLLAGYSFWNGGTIFQPLWEAMATRGVRATFFVNIDTDGLAASAAELAAFPAPELADRSLRRMFERNWPFGAPFPDVYFDPRTARANPSVSLHAKCVVVDDETCLIGSANFTDRGQSRNYEAGALLVDHAFAERLTGQWWSLVAAGQLVRWEPRSP